jgi:hypothetical protein
LATLQTLTGCVKTNKNPEALQKFMWEIDTKKIFPHSFVAPALIGTSAMTPVPLATVPEDFMAQDP